MATFAKALAPEAGGFLRSLFRNGVWKTVGQAAEGHLAKPGLSGVLANAAHGTSKFMGGKGGHALGAYGIAGMLSPMAGVNLPGSNLARNVTMPGYGALFSAAPAITSARLAGSKAQGQIENDVRRGAQTAGTDFMTLAQMDGNTIADPIKYRQVLQNAGVDLKGADAYRTHTAAKPMGAWETLGNMFEDPQKIVDQRVKQKVQSYLDKSAFAMLGKEAGIGDLAGRAMKAGGKAMPWLMGALGLGTAAHALMAEKPYDETAVQQEGYSGAQSAIQKGMEGMTNLQRLTVKADPTLAIGELEKKMPGTIKAWEKGTGKPYTPGFLQGIKESWQQGGKPSYYTTDAAGTRTYFQ